MTENCLLQHDGASPHITDNSNWYANSLFYFMVLTSILFIPITGVSAWNSREMGMENGSRNGNLQNFLLFIEWTTV